MRTRASAAGLLLIALLAFGAGAPSALADGEPAEPAAPGAPTQAAYLAERLSEDPMYISDSMPRQVPRSGRGVYVEQLDRTGVPTFLIVLPDHVAQPGGDGLLAAVHDRLGEDGLYVLMEGATASVTAQAYGVDLTAETLRIASRSVLYELHYSSGSLAALTRFVDTLLDEDPGPRVEEAAERYRESGDSRENKSTSHDERVWQSVRTGAALTAVPMVLIGGSYLYRRRTGRGPHWPRVAVPVAAAGMALVAVAAPAVFHQERVTDDPPPAPSDMTDRLRLTAAAIADDPLFVHPELAPVLGPAAHQRLSERLAGAEEDHYVLLLPFNRLDEVQGREDHFVQQLHQEREAREDAGPAIYTVIDSRRGRLESYNYGVPKDFDSNRYGPTRTEFAEGSSPERALDTLLTRLEEASGAEPGTPPAPFLEIAEADNRKLDPLYSAPVLLGVPLAAAGGGLLLGLLWLADRAFQARGAAGAGRRHTLDKSPPPRPDAPAQPSARWLNRTALAELNLLAGTFDQAASEALPEERRNRVWDCLDAATLLLDPKSGGRIAADLPEEEVMAAVALLRAGQQAYEQTDGPLPRRLCGLNPLHGPGRTDREVSRDSGERRHLRTVCDGCAALLPRRGRPVPAQTLEVLLLRIPEHGKSAGGRGGRRVGYHLSSGLLRPRHARGLSIDELITNAREVRGVR